MFSDMGSMADLDQVVYFRTSSDSGLTRSCTVNDRTGSYFDFVFNNHCHFPKIEMSKVEIFCKSMESVSGKCK